MSKTAAVRHLVVVLGDQLDAESAAFDGFDPAQDVVLQMEVAEEATYVPQHKMRIAYFFAAMRHFRAELEARGRTVHYMRLDDPANTGAFDSEIARHQAALQPQATIVLEPGEFRVREKLRQLPQRVELRADRHFLCTADEFDAFTERHPRPIMETFYRAMRRKTGLLLDEGGRPVGGSWNFDAENRKGFGKSRPPIPLARSYAPDAITRDVLKLVAARFSNSPGRLDRFDLPVSRVDALTELSDFVASPCSAPIRTRCCPTSRSCITRGCRGR